jgi:hypothetical protein
MKTMRTLAVLALALIVPLAAAAQEGGGTSGADFLVSPPSARTTGLAGAADLLGLGLEAMEFNPAGLAPLDGMRLQVTLDPLPNGVMSTHLGFGFPVLGGYAAAAAQLLNTGGFTLINSEGQPEATFNVYDAALGFSYGRYLWRTIAVGADVKALYRTLGTEYAFAVAANAGAAAWFETPHVGQRPKAPTRKQLEAEFNRQKAGIDAEKAKMTAVTAKQSTEARRDLETAEKAVADLDGQLAAAPDGKKEPIAARKQDAEVRRDAEKQKLADAEKSESGALAEIDTWYQARVAKAQALFDKKMADLDSIGAERARLFEVIDDPAKELTPEALDAAITNAIEKSQGLRDERTAAAGQRRAAYEQRLMAQADATRTSIEGYETMANEAAGPQRAELSKEIEALRAEKATLEQDKTANKDRLAEIAKLIPAKEKQLGAIAADPWIKRLEDRISAKRKDLAQLDASSAAMAQETEKTIAAAAAAAARDEKDFNALRDALQKELKRAKLKRELDLVSVRSEAAAAKVQASYKAKERALYLRLLNSLYRHEENIFQDRLAAAKDATAIRALDFQADQEKAKDALDDGWAFDDRLLAAKVAELSRDSPKGSPELKAAQDERAAREAAYRKAVAELETKQKTFDASEKAALADATANLTAGREKMRLIYLQTDKPYMNTAVALGVRNVGSPVKFVSESVALPMAATANVSYAVVNTQDHNVKIAAQAEVPLSAERISDWSVGIGAEYVFASLAYARVGYNINETSSGLGAISAGLGVHLMAGFTGYAVDYAFKPLEGYGFQHSIGVSISF